MRAPLGRTQCRAGQLLSQSVWKLADLRDPHATHERCLLQNTRHAVRYVKQCRHKKDVSEKGNVVWARE